MKTIEVEHRQGSTDDLEPFTIEIDDDQQLHSVMTAQIGGGYIGWQAVITREVTPCQAGEKI